MKTAAQTAQLIFHVLCFFILSSFLVALLLPGKKGREPAHFPSRHSDVPTETSTQAAPTGAGLAVVSVKKVAVSEGDW
jgi:hypothetical protein